jgi:hypothetical protein
LRPDALTRLGLEASQEAQLRELTTIRPPAATPSQRERVELAVRDVTTATARDLPQPWADSVDSAAVATSDELSQALDAAVSRVDLRLQRPGWWPAVNVLQVALVAAAVVGLLWWLLMLTGVVGSPSVGGVSVASLLLVDAVGLGAVIAVGARWMVHVGARHRRARVAAQLRSVVSGVAIERVVAPIAGVVIDHRTTRRALEGS